MPNEPDVETLFRLRQLLIGPCENCGGHPHRRDSCPTCELRTLAEELLDYFGCARCGTPGGLHAVTRLCASCGCGACGRQECEGDCAGNGTRDG
jgi:hypothetical protein